MPKTIVVCCDGTANETSTDPTNVSKLFRTLPKRAPGQVAYYHPGVGTRSPPGFVTQGGQRTAKLLGLAFGYGLTDDLCDAYLFLTETFEPGDTLFLFGFSRGAYTVRALASMLRMYGLIAPGNPALAPYIVRMLWAIQTLRKRERPGVDDPGVRAYFELAARFKATFSISCRPYFVGVWDTVSAVGWFTTPVALPYTANNSAIAVGRHAIAIDERRTFFRSNPWVPRPGRSGEGPRDLRQVWFPGVHSDVGGGYPEAESGLSKLALEWMIGEAVLHGLQVVPNEVELVLGRRGGDFKPPDPDARLHESLRGPWRLLEPVPMPRWNAVAKARVWQANRGARRTIPPGAVVHDAAWARAGGRYAAERLPAGAVKLSQAVWPV